VHLPHSLSCLLFLFGVSGRFNPVAWRRNRHFSWRRNKNAMRVLPHSPLAKATYYLIQDTAYSFQIQSIYLYFPSSKPRIECYQSVSIFRNF
jgi:hypothetical protein